MALEINQIHQGDCVSRLSEVDAGSVDLVFADPPFNIGFDYDVYDDKVEHQQYIDWSVDWIQAVARVLKHNGTFWLAIGDEYAAELKLESQRLGFHCRSWVIWYYTFGVNCAKKFTRSHAHLFHFVRDPDDFTFRDQDLDNRVPSARELVYNDRRANPIGRLPDDTWIIRPSTAVGEMVGDDGTWSPDLLATPADRDRTYTLRPQDLTGSFSPHEDTWYIPRVAGTFKERAGFHGCQMPEQLLGRIIRTCSHPGDLVVDPFSGSATTLAVAKKLGRKYLGFDLSVDYVEYGAGRLDSIRVGDRLDGSPEPTKSAPRTAARGKKPAASRKKTAPRRAENELQEAERRYDQAQCDLTLRGVLEAFQQTHDGFSADRVVTDPQLNQQFVAACDKLGLVGDARTWNTLLFRLRKRGALSIVDTHRRTRFSWDDCDPYLFASEIAWQSLLNDKSAASIDEILCDPALAARFDEIAEQFAPGHKPIDYRWAALKLRKQASTARSRAAVLSPPQLGPLVRLDDIQPGRQPAEPGLYVISESETRQLYVGETANLRQLMTLQVSRRSAWASVSETLLVQTVSLDQSAAGKLAWQSCLVKKFERRPKLNCCELRSPA